MSPKFRDLWSFGFHHGSNGHLNLCSATRQRDRVRNLLHAGICTIERDGPGATDTDYTPVLVEGSEAALALAIYLPQSDIRTQNLLSLWMSQRNRSRNTPRRLRSSVSITADPVSRTVDADCSENRIRESMKDEERFYGETIGRTYASIAPPICFAELVQNH